MANSGAPGAMLEMREVVTTARALGLKVMPIEVKQADEIFSSMSPLKTAQTHFMSQPIR